MAKKNQRDFVSVVIGRLQQGNPNHGLPVNCYACGTTHPGSGVARVQYKQSTLDVPLCDACVSKDDSDIIVRKFLNVPDLKFRKRGKSTAEQIAALAEKQDKTEH